MYCTVPVTRYTRYTAYTKYRVYCVPGSTGRREKEKNYLVESIRWDCVCVPETKQETIKKEDGRHFKSFSPCCQSMPNVSLIRWHLLVTLDIE